MTQIAEETFCMEKSAKQHGKYFIMKVKRRKTNRHIGE
jgi:hypothetical protein